MATRDSIDQINDLADLTADDIDTIADEYVRRSDLSKKVKVNQIRNVFTSIAKQRNDFKKLKQAKTEDQKTVVLDSIKREMILLKPMLAYAAGRQKEVKIYQDFMRKTIDKTKDSYDLEKAIKNFFILSEAVLAYHKFYGGNN